MRLSTQMLTGIVGITIISQLVLGMIAYWVLAGVERDHLLRVTRERTAEVAQAIAVPLATGTREQKALERAARLFAPAVDVILLIEGGRIVASTGPLAKEIDLARIPAAVLQPHARDQLVEIDEGRFLVTRQRVPGLDYSLLALQEQRLSREKMIARFGFRSLAFSVILLWVAVWVALMLASSINRKIEQKNRVLRRQVTHDSLTGLPNRALFTEHINAIINLPGEFDNRFMVMVVGIDGYTEITDTLGHDVGEQLLLEMAGRINQAVDQENAVARLEGEKLGVLLTDTDSESGSHSVRQFLDGLDRQVSISGMVLDIRLSIGAALYPTHACDADSLLRYADIALRQARERKAEYLFYDDDADFSSMHRLMLGSELPHAIARGELIAVYQPKMSLATSKVCGLEALVRWEHPREGSIPPTDFIPLAEQSGVIRELTEMMLDQAVHFLHRLHARGHNLDISVNISAHNLRDDKLPEFVEALLTRTGAQARHLCLEITETVMMQDIEQAQRVLERLHRLGVRLSIDDFGTGFSSLSYLNLLPVDEIKIDRSFVTHMLTQESDQAVVNTIIQLAHTLHCQIVAEGVEDEETLALLRTLGCDIAQGYLISPPRAVADLENWLLGSDHKTTAQVVDKP
ncbi:MAG TPA: EAL domain-containing protein [Gammaproteobacteria bacterium]|nr:EAL domain-containing protein [Gammaproteobacteria bacterium]